MPVESNDVSVVGRNDIGACELGNTKSYCLGTGTFRRLQYWNLPTVTQTADKNSYYTS